MEQGTSTVEQAQGRNDQTHFNPFPGLRPFTIQESHLFFGREGQSEEILNSLAEHRFVGVIGSSGSGKSSLMYCGLVPILHGGFITDAGSRWRVIAARPGGGPIDNLAEAIAKNEVPDANDEELKIRRAITQSILKSSDLGLVETISHMEKEEDENVLILIDQFEELFRFRKSRNDESSYNESVAFVKLLLNAVKQTEVPVYVVLTMRSDFIGECSQFQELTKLINDSHYLIPQMTREDIAKAIEGPVAVGGGQISPRLTQRLLNDIGDKQDQLPILQHSLMRTWNYWSRFGGAGEEMDVTHYEAIGTMERALSEHANEAYDELDEREKEICESVFKSLTERGTDNRGIRRPSKVKEVAEIALAEEHEVVKVIDTFRLSGRSFLTSGKQELTSESIIDISHESLMRIWNRLIVWVDEEANAVQMYIRLSQAAGSYQDGKTGLWRPPDLQMAINWRGKQKPTLTWAQRYAPEFERTMLYLDTSEKAYIAEERNKVKLQKKALRRSRNFAVIMGVAAIFLLGVLVWAFMQYVEANAQRQKVAETLKEVEAQKELALENERLAVQKEAEATRSAEEAKIAQDEALKQKEKADEEARIAKEARDAADKSAAEARKQTNIARAQTEKAKQAQELAQENEQKANQQKERANQQKEKAREASKDARRMRRLSIAQSMAVKSLQIRRDDQKKALIAFQAYQFNKDYGGEEHHSDIYAGLYDAVKALEPERFKNLGGHTAAVRGLQVDKNSQALFSTGSDGKIFKWTGINGEQTPVSTVIGQETAIIRSLDVSNDGKWLITSSESGNLNLYDLVNNGFVKKLEGHKDVAYHVEFLPDNRSVLSTGADTTMFVWNIQTGEKQQVYKGTSPIKSFATSKDGNYIVAGTEAGNVVVLDRNNNYEALPVLETPGRAVTSVVFSNSGRYLAVGNIAGYVRILDAFNSYGVVQTLIGHTARINDMAFSEDDKFFASASFDKTVQLYNTSDYNISPIVMNDHESWVWSLDFTADGSTLLTGTVSNEIKRYPTSMDQMASDMCSKFKRNMTEEEWKKYVAEDIDYERTCMQISH